MGYTVVDLKDRIMEIHPEIEANGIVVNAVFDEELNSCVVRFRKGTSMLSTHLEKMEARRPAAARCHDAEPVRAQRAAGVRNS